jgi:ankyrin repeat protein
MEALHQPGDIVADRYRITDILGQGGVGITYAAEDLKSGETVALKALSLRQMGDWKVLELFEREAKILAQLNHPAIPRYLDYFHVDTPEDHAFYIAQQVVEGKSLAELVKNGWRTNEAGVQRIAAQVLQILAYLHGLKPPVVHRDIKPQNLIWVPLPSKGGTQKGQVFLVDFGAVQDTYRSTLVKSGTIVGTFGYMAPEQFQGQAVPATDLYGLGATLLFLVTHRSPAELPTERLKISFRSRLQLSERFGDWLEKMLEPDVEERFSSAKEALASLRGNRSVAKSRFKSWWIGLAGVGIVTVASGVWFFNRTPSEQTTASSGHMTKPSIELSYAKHVNVHFKNSIGATPLHEATSKEVAELLIARGADIHTRDNNGQTPLHWTSWLRSKEVAELLITKGADVSAKDNQGATPLHWTDSKEVAELLIASGAEVNAKDNKGLTPLHWTDSKGVAELLIANGAEVNAKDNKGLTPLHRTPSKEVAELLIAKGADVNTKDNRSATPLHRTGSKKVAELLIANGAEVNAKDNQGATPLHWTDSRKVAELLIANGAEVNAKDNRSATPLHWTDSRKVAELLLTRGADIHVKDNYGATPLHWTRSKAVAALLIAKGANIHFKDNQGLTPLHWTDSREVAELLIAQGADVNAKDDRGATPLHRTPSKEVAELLIAKGADVNAKDSRNLTPLYWAQDLGRIQIVALLEIYGGKE